MRVWANAPREDWIIDRLVKEFSEQNCDIWASNPNDADVLWLYSDFSWRDAMPYWSTSKTVLSTVHHIVPQKMDAAAERDFAMRDSITTVYHVPNVHTAEEVSKRTNKSIHIIPYWANQLIWQKNDKTKQELRQKYNIPEKGYFVVGSFQRDTEGAGIAQGIFNPKLEKGPDLFIEFVQHILCNEPHNDWRKVFVVLAGWRRQYVIQHLERLQIPYLYLERPPQQTICELYQTLSVYAVTSRYEGGPQALIEAGLLDVPVVSTDVGIASAVLPPESIAVGDDFASVMKATVPNVKQLMLPQGFQPYRELFDKLCVR